MADRTGGSGRRVTPGFVRRPIASPLTGGGLSDFDTNSCSCIRTPVHWAPLKGKPLGTLRMHLVAAQSVARNVSSDSSASDQKKYVIHRPELKLTQGSKVIATVPRDAKPSDLRAAKKDPLYTLRTGGLDLGHGLGHGLGSAVVRRIQIGMVLQ